MSDPLNIMLLAYPDNPVGGLFLQCFLEANIQVSGVVIEKKTHHANLRRFVEKIRKDGFSSTGQRILDMMRLKFTCNRIVDLAVRHGIPVFAFEDMNSQACADLLEIQQPDLLVIASAPILKSRIFQKARLGCLNPHPGWLPQYRGIGANAHAVQNNDQPGITIHYVDEKIDTGKIIVRERIQICHKDTIAKINDRAMARGAQLMVRVIRDIQTNTLKLPEIEEPLGKLYTAMSFQEAQKLNKRLKSLGE